MKIITILKERAKDKFPEMSSKEIKEYVDNYGVTDLCESSAERLALQDRIYYCADKRLSRMVKKYMTPYGLHIILSNRG